MKLSWHHNGLLLKDEKESSGSLLEPNGQHCTRGKIFADKHDFLGNLPPQRAQRGKR